MNCRNIVGNAILFQLLKRNSMHTFDDTFPPSPKVWVWYPWCLNRPLEANVLMIFILGFLKKESSLLLVPSMTTLRTWLSLNCFSLSPKMPTRMYSFISIPRVVQSHAGLAIYDTMQFINSEVSTMCIGQAASMGAFLLAGGAKGKRYCLPNSRS